MAQGSSEAVAARRDVPRAHHKTDPTMAEFIQVPRGGLAYPEIVEDYLVNFEPVNRADGKNDREVAPTEGRHDLGIDRRRREDHSVKHVVDYRLKSSDIFYCKKGIDN